MNKVKSLLLVFAICLGFSSCLVVSSGPGRSYGYGGRSYHGHRHGYNHHGGGHYYHGGGGGRNHHGHGRRY